MFDLDLALRFAAALGLGLLLGIERERKRDAELFFGGVRTFALIALLGAVGAFMERELNQGWLIIAAFVALSALVIVSYATTAARGELGITTEISSMLAFIVGALCGWQHVGVASVATVVCLLLLTFKDFLHRLARRVELADIEATLTFAVISVIILPLLPNQNFGPPPLDVINPYKIWLMVVLIAGLNFLGYVLVKVLGNEHGLALTGILGGLVSSTARLDAAAPQAASATSDKALDSRIENRIHSDATLKKYNIDVDVDGGVATLTGTVATEGDRAKAANLAKVNGVSRVENKILVDLNAATTGTAGTIKEKTKEGAEKTKNGAEKAIDKTKDGAKVVGEKTKDGAVKVADEVTDAYLISKLHADFINEDSLKGSDINVDSDDHVVTLKGTVMSQAGRARAVAIAKGTKGVKRVVDHLTIGPKK